MAFFDYPGSGVPNPVETEITFLADLSEAEWARILKVVETRQFRAGENLIQSGDQDDAFYLLTSGEVDVLIGSEEDERIITTIAEGSVFGEIAFFDQEARTATIRARSRGSAVRITRENFETLAAWEPGIARRMLVELGRILAMRLRWTLSIAFN
ncbi:MAG: cyclic nucleotide-binding domain-containing protein [Alphaproteobacteria bacterium]|nr:cyclic nucleotide-binding domain-containing protein [Alphaproteobacteria bacterium]